MDHYLVAEDMAKKGSLQVFTLEEWKQSMNTFRVRTFTQTRQEAVCWIAGYAAGSGTR